MDRSTDVLRPLTEICKRSEMHHVHGWDAVQIVVRHDDFRPTAVVVVDDHLISSVFCPAWVGLRPVRNESRRSKCVLRLHRPSDHVAPLSFFGRPEWSPLNGPTPASAARGWVWGGGSPPKSLSMFRANTPEMPLAPLAPRSDQIYWPGRDIQPPHARETLLRGAQQWLYPAHNSRRVPNRAA